MLGDEETFVCYNCRDGLCDDCVGVPCQCECDIKPADRDFEEEYY